MVKETSKEPAAVWVATDALRPWDKNPRRNEAAVDRVAASIQRFGFGSNIVARRSGEIIAGHTRWLAAKKLGLVEVPVRYLDLSDADAHALAIADNKLGEIAEWDDEKLQEVMAELQRDTPDVIAVLGFNDVELEMFGVVAGPQPTDHPPQDGPEDLTNNATVMLRVVVPLVGQGTAREAIERALTEIGVTFTIETGAG